MIQYEAAYIPSMDRTVIFKTTYDNNGEMTSETVSGWYAGEPNEELTEIYKEDLVAEFTKEKTPQYKVKDGYIDLFYGPASTEYIDHCQKYGIPQEDIDEAVQEYGEEIYSELEEI